MANLKRGFSRLASLAAALAAPIFLVIALKLSTQQVGWRPDLLTSNYPNLQRFEEPSTVVIPDVGVAYFPSGVSQQIALAQSKGLFDPESHPELFERSPGKDPLSMLVDFVRDSKLQEFEGMNSVQIAKHMVERDSRMRNKIDLKEYEMRPVYRRRSLLALGVAVAATVAFALLLQALVFAVSWVARGFRGSNREDR